jgi:hypothetical protein
MTAAAFPTPVGKAACVRAAADDRPGNKISSLNEHESKKGFTLNW